VIRIIIILIACLGFSQASLAGGVSQQNSTVQFRLEDIASFSKRVEKTLAEKRAVVALVARNGRPLGGLPEGVRYTHVGFAVYSKILLEDGSSQKGYAFHNLYQLAEQPDKSEIVVDFALDFFAGASEMKAGIIIPHPELQRKLYDVIVDNKYREFHNPEYSAISNPFDTRFQNCTEFVMNVTQSAIYDLDKMSEIKEYLRRSFDPYELPYGEFALNLASISSKDISMRDQTYPFVTTTFSSISTYMISQGFASEVIELSDPLAEPLVAQTTAFRPLLDAEAINAR